MSGPVGSRVSNKPVYSAAWASAMVLGTRCRGCDIAALAQVAQFCPLVLCLRAKRPRVFATGRLFCRPSGADTPGGSGGAAGSPCGHPGESRGGGEASGRPASGAARPPGGCGQFAQHSPRLVAQAGPLAHVTHRVPQHVQPGRPLEEFAGDGWRHREFWRRWAPRCRRVMGATGRRHMRESRGGQASSAGRQWTAGSTCVERC